jgi:hypothetical protein
LGVGGLGFGDLSLGVGVWEFGGQGDHLLHLGAQESLLAILVLSDTGACLSNKVWLAGVLGACSSMYCYNQ